MMPVNFFCPWLNTCAETQSSLLDTLQSTQEDCAMTISVLFVVPTCFHLNRKKEKKKKKRQGTFVLCILPCWSNHLIMFTVRLCSHLHSQPAFRFGAGECYFYSAWRGTNSGSQGLCLNPIFWRKCIDGSLSVGATSGGRKSLPSRSNALLFPKAPGETKTLENLFHKSPDHHGDKVLSPEWKHVPSALKTAIIGPHLKKMTHDPEVLADWPFATPLPGTASVLSCV